LASGEQRVPGADFEASRSRSERVAAARSLAQRSTSAAIRSPERTRARSHGVEHPVFGEWLTLGASAHPHGHPLGLTLAHTEEVARALRGALLRHAIDPPPAALSGHEPNGARLERPHAAFVALPDLESSAAALPILGAAVLLPRDIEPADRASILLAAERFERSGMRLAMGRLGALDLARASGDRDGGALDSNTWTRPSRRWASVTAIALPRNPGDLVSKDPTIAARADLRARSIIADACEQVGLPRPIEVRVSRRSAVASAPPAHAFAPYPRLGKGFKRVCLHAILEFSDEVPGPIVIGAGRYFGLGLLQASGTGGSSATQARAVRGR
jgi:CRISPR-associated protein Csb2